MRRNPLLYSDPNEIEQSPTVAAAPTPPPQEASGKSSFLFYLIILANSLLVLFVLGFIWFLFLKSPDIQIKDLTNRLFGMSSTTESSQPLPTSPVVTPQIEPEVITTPTQQEKDEIQQAKLKQMREREELAAERARLETIKAEIETERMRANEAQQALAELEQQRSNKQNTQDNSSNASITTTAPETIAAEDKPVQTDKTPPAQAPAATSLTDTQQQASEEPSVVPNAASEPDQNTTQSQVDRIMEALKSQQQN